MGTITQNPNGEDAPNESLIPETFHLEDEAFRKLLPELLKKYRHEFVALHEGELADHDIDPFILGKRIRQAFGKKFVLIRAVDPLATQTESTLDLTRPI